MRRLLPFAALLASLLVPRPAFPCGGGFGEQLVVEPEQEIVIAHRNGVESYLLSPQFCGAATEFGLILPIPGVLVRDPTLGGDGTPPAPDATLFDELANLSQPDVEYVEVCSSSSPSCVGCMGSESLSGGDKSNGPGGRFQGVDVIDAGQVGQFTWSLLLATNTAAFTDWLTANSFPYDAQATTRFDHYVTRAWYFIAFKVTAGAAGPPAGQKLCGDLGPILLEFEAAQPVIPARIAAVETAERGGNYLWRVYAIAPTQLRNNSIAALDSMLYFSGPLSASLLSSYPQLGLMALPDERLTVLDISFWAGAVDDDIYFADDPNPYAFRSVRIEQIPVECGCSGIGSNGFSTGLLLVVLGILLGLGRRLRRGVAR